MLSQIALAPLAGILYTALGAARALGINAVSFGLSAIVLVGLRLPATPALPLALISLAVYGMGTSSGAVTFNSLLQTHTSEHARGRIFASFDVFWQLGRVTSLLVGGLLAAAIGIQAVYYLGGALLLLAAAIGGTATRQLDIKRARRQGPNSRS